MEDPPRKQRHPTRFPFSTAKVLPRFINFSSSVNTISDGGGTPSDLGSIAMEAEHKELTTVPFTPSLFRSTGSPQNEQSHALAPRHGLPESERA